MCLVFLKYRATTTNIRFMGKKCRKNEALAIVLLAVGCWRFDLIKNEKHVETKHLPAWLYFNWTATPILISGTLELVSTRLKGGTRPNSCTVECWECIITLRRFSPT